ncbi:MAG TPA: AmmeMemoRadiSam system protein B [Candidatus Krumholzibacteria bacterium]|nr:AmmeMemoRadiSam system protein B [Candidatus Krumholzibacteria bacterium]
MPASSGIRPPAVAGSFYPASASVLAREVDQFLAACPAPAPSGAVQAVLAPHAGYRYSGAIAARAFASAVPRAAIDTVVLVGPSHVEAFDFTSVFEGDAFATPLGVVAVDTGLARALLARGGSLRLSSRGHLSGGGRGEHALEVMLPFIQRTLPAARIVPVTMGSQSRAACVALADSLAAHVDFARTLIVASSDLSHFRRYDEAVRLDTAFCQLVSGGDGEALLAGLTDGRCEACGGGPTAAVMLACARARGTSAHVLARINSGDVTGERDSVVGYAAAAFAEAS